MKKFVSKLFSGATDSLSYFKETKDFLLGIIIPVIAFILSLLIPVNTPLRILVVLFLGLLFFMTFLYLVRLISVSDNKEANNIKRDNYKFKHKPINLPIADFEYWIKNADMPETLYVKSSLKINYKFMIDFETQGKNGLFINKRFYLDNKELSDERECVKVFQELNIIFDDYILVYETFDHNRPEIIIEIVDKLKSKK